MGAERASIEAGNTSQASPTEKGRFSPPNAIPTSSERDACAIVHGEIRWGPQVARSSTWSVRPSDGGMFVECKRSRRVRRKNLLGRA